MDEPSDIASRIDTVGSSRLLRVRSDRLEQDLRAMTELGLDGVALARVWGFQGDSLDFLQGYDLRALMLVGGDRWSGFEQIERMTSLETLAAGISGPGLDLSQHACLRYLTMGWSPKVKFAPMYPRLETLRLWKYNPAVKDLTGLPDAPLLRTLLLVQGAIRSTRGVGRYEALRYFEVSRIPALAELVDLPGGLKEMHMEFCKNVGDVSAAASCSHLEFLKLSDCGTVQSIAFVRRLGALQKLTFGGTTVADGDVSPCFGIPYVHFKAKPHYNHKLTEFNHQLTRAAATMGE